MRESKAKLHALSWAGGRVLEVQLTTLCGWLCLDAVEHGTRCKLHNVWYINVFRPRTGPAAGVRGVGRGSVVIPTPEPKTHNGHVGAGRAAFDGSPQPQTNRTARPAFHAACKGNWLDFAGLSLGAVRTAAGRQHPDLATLRCKFEERSVSHVPLYSQPRAPRMDNSSHIKLR